MADRAVAITGVGVVSPAGIGVGPLWELLLSGRSAVKKVDAFDASGFTSQVGGQIDNFSARDFLPKSYRKAVKVMMRDIEIAVAAADLAFRDAGIVTRASDGQPMTVEPRRLGCNIGAGLISPDLDELGMALQTALDEQGKFSLARWGSGGMNNLTPLWLLKYLPNMLSCHVTIVHGCEGPSNCITCGDASAHLSVGEAGQYIAEDRADVAIAGGSESKLNPMGYLRQGLLLNRLVLDGGGDPGGSCRPFDRDHRGAVIGEGGALLVLEALDRAVARGAKVYAELVGLGGACDPGGIDVTKANAGSLDLAVKRAMDDAGIGPQDVDLAIAHGTGVPEEDRREAECWRAALGAAAERVPVVALTGAIGSLFAGAGGPELAVAAMAVREQRVPVSVNFRQAADGCELNVSRESRPAAIRHVVTGAFSIGGQSGACVLRRHEG
jgi:3-oxoacyl-[acyl-carrier-protein] synthase II